MSTDRPVIVLRVEEPLTEELADKIRSAFDEPNERWVLVKGYHDSGTIDGVFGPYTLAYADWLLAGPCENSCYQWTKHKLSNGPEAT